MPFRFKLGSRARARGRRQARQRPTEKASSLVPDDADVVTSYRIGSVNYVLYRVKGESRLSVGEPPEPPRERLERLLLGIEQPANEAEAYHLEKRRSGYGAIYPLIIDPNVEEIAYTRHSEPVMAVHKLEPDGWVKTNIRLTAQEADAIALSLAYKAGRQLSLANPIAEGVTPEGHRVAVTYSREVSKFGSTFVVRKHPQRPVTIADAIAWGMITPLEAAYLWMLLEAQQFILVVGPMGSGKTTLLQALATLIPPNKRVVTIEDSPELKLPQPGWDSLHTRPPAPGEELLAIDMEELLKFALRRRADYIIVGEVRGREARLLAQAAAIGHGSMATFHAYSAEAALARLAMEPIGLPPLFLKSIGAIVTVRRMLGFDGSIARRVAEVAEVAGDELRVVFEYDPEAGEAKPSNPLDVAESSMRVREAWERLGRPSGSPAAELEARASFLEDLVEADRDEVPARIAGFYARRARPPA